MWRRQQKAQYCYNLFNVFQAISTRKKHIMVRSKLRLHQNMRSLYNTSSQFPMDNLYMDIRHSLQLINNSQDHQQAILKASLLLNLQKSPRKKKKKKGSLTELKRYSNNFRLLSSLLISHATLYTIRIEDYNSLTNSKMEQRKTKKTENLMPFLYDLNREELILYIENCVVPQKASTPGNESEELANKLKECQNSIESLKVSLRSKDKIIADYDDKYEKFEEELQKAKLDQKVFKQKAAALDSKVANLLSEITTLKKENEGLILEREKDAAANAQERVEFAKTISVLEMQIATLLKDKAEEEKRLSKKRHTPKASLSQTRTPTLEKPEKQIQTDTILLQTTFTDKSPAMDKMVEYEKSLEQEIRVLQAKLTFLNETIEKLKSNIETKDKAMKNLEQALQEVKKENIELRKRRELAANEINKLQHIVRSSSKSLVDSGKSETIISGVKKELEKLYKEFVTCFFSESLAKVKFTAEEIKKQSMVENKLNRIIERLSDYCENNEGTGAFIGKPARSPTTSTSAVSTPVRTPLAESDKVSVAKKLTFDESQRKAVSSLILTVYTHCIVIVIQYEHAIVVYFRLLVAISLYYYVCFT
eukprot:TRINITY_DN183_c0_g1_i1.p2 TRINITY_DN183_c0_g1~~TRINITY_DN183_c0_g1_i1.p2  ORF type:complete len:592 (-),score=74.32 TRINITY_DN183_c0_g1_i1:28-1803(-)